MRKNYTLFYLVNNFENPEIELLDDDLFDSGLEDRNKDIFSYLDNHLAEIGQPVVERILAYTDLLFKGK